MTVRQDKTEQADFMTRLDEFLLNRVAPGMDGAIKAVLNPRYGVAILVIGGKLALAVGVLDFLFTQYAVALEDYERFTSSVGFDSDQRHMIDPIGGERDANGNLVRSRSSSLDGGVSSSCGAMSTAVGNLLSVVVEGTNNTVIVNSNQTNTGDVTATSSLNGRIQLPCF
jgi:hypothetical protein